MHIAIFILLLFIAYCYLLCHIAVVYCILLFIMYCSKTFNQSPQNSNNLILYATNVNIYFFAWFFKNKLLAQLHSRLLMSFFYITNKHRNDDWL